ncbi:NADP-dependent oxidoreductase [Rhodococcus sp. ARC_M6]|uniref:MDR family NADP-dependent oxidoreductase n=1 Tax=Rhodococcus sp. ARC_M6 TaxID=2928852 RepID=UPI001FB3F297|nr:NADP-dependent oxidoreductase [Rhodococcus sp. ARC_M6]MCJ0906883.1 NADP-dependent oxidoreductase [Rhodococcus sp. ARC_M6]
MNTAVRVIRAPQGLPRAEDFSIGTAEVRQPRDGEVLFRASLLAIDPSARRRLPASDGRPGPLGAVAGIGGIVLAGVSPPQAGLDGALVGEVVASRHPEFVPGDLVRGGNTWQVFHTFRGEYLDLLEPRPGFQLEAELGVLGRPGFVAYCGLHFAAKLEAGMTVVISAAGGAVGMVAGQLAALAGARVVGIASGDKVAYVVDELGLADCIDRTNETITAGLARTCPEGVDLYFDNAGGETLAAVFEQLNDFGQVVVCGMASEYNGAEADFGPPLRPVLRKRLKIQGFVVYDHYEHYPRYREWALEQLDAGRLRYRVDVVDGLENAPRALANVLTGRNRGRQLVQLGPLPHVLGQRTRQGTQPDTVVGETEGVSA